jgi:hypothetical protein
MSLSPHSRAGYRHPLAFLLGLDGVTPLRAHAGDGFDREFADPRSLARV